MVVSCGEFQENLEVTRHHHDVTARNWEPFRKISGMVEAFEIHVVKTMPLK